MADHPTNIPGRRRSDTASASARPLDHQQLTGHRAPLRYPGLGAGSSLLPACREHGRPGLPVQRLRFGSRCGKPVWQEYFQFPSGRLDPEEPLRAGAAWGLKEETGVTVVPVT